MSRLAVVSRADHERPGFTEATQLRSGAYGLLNSRFCFRCRRSGRHSAHGHIEPPVSWAPILDDCIYRRSSRKQTVAGPRLPTSRRLGPTSRCCTSLALTLSAVAEDVRRPDCEDLAADILRRSHNSVARRAARAGNWARSWAVWRSSRRRITMGTPERPTFIAHWSEIERPDDKHYDGDDELMSIGAPFGRHSGLTKLGIHHERLLPGRRTSFPHAESVEEEFVYHRRHA